jgi:hypothetical protein
VTGIATIYFAQGAAEIRLRAAKGDAVLSLALPPREAQRLARELSRALMASGLFAKKKDVPIAPACTGKRGWPSADAAKLAHRGASWRVRVYPCRDCGQFHTANADKGRRRGQQKKESK